MIEVADHLPAIALLRLLTIGLGSFAIGMSAYTAYVYLKLPPDLAAYRRHVLLLSAAIVLLATGVIVNHITFAVRDEPFHAGSLMFPPAFALMFLGMRDMLRIVAERRSEDNGRRSRDRSHR